MKALLTIWLVAGFAVVGVIGYIEYAMIERTQVYATPHQQSMNSIIIEGTMQETASAERLQPAESVYVIQPAQRW